MIAELLAADALGVLRHGDRVRSDRRRHAAAGIAHPVPRRGDRDAARAAIRRAVDGLDRHRRECRGGVEPGPAVGRGGANGGAARGVRALSAHLPSQRALRRRQRRRLVLRGDAVHRARSGVRAETPRLDDRRRAHRQLVVALGFAHGLHRRRALDPAAGDRVQRAHHPRRRARYGAHCRRAGAGRSGGRRRVRDSGARQPEVAAHRVHSPMGAGADERPHAVDQSGVRCRDRPLLLTLGRIQFSRAAAVVPAGGPRERAQQLSPAPRRAGDRRLRGDAVAARPRPRGSRRG